MAAIMTKTPAGEDIVILSRAEYDRLISAGEDAADARVASAALERVHSGAEALIPDEDMDAFLAAPTPLAFWRKKRGLSQAALAAAAGVSQGYVSEIEAGKKTGDVATLRRFATALGLRIDDLVGEE